MTGAGIILILAGTAGLSRVLVNGGSPEPVAKLAGDEAIFSGASALPGGAYLVSVRATTTTDDASRVAVVIPDGVERLVIAERGGTPTFVAGHEPGFGHIVYAEAGRLIALPFDADRRVVKGAAVPIVENVAMRPNGDTAHYAVFTGGDPRLPRRIASRARLDRSRQRGDSAALGEPAPVRASALIA